MSVPADPLALAHWRRSVAELYAAVRSVGGSDPQAVAQRFRAGREELFRSHPESPIAAERRRDWPGLAWFAYDPAWRVMATFERLAPCARLEIELAADGLLRCARVGRVRFALRGEPATLAVYWLEGYGGGLWLPFSDASCGRETYGGGRYLYDTIKGADLDGGDPGGTDCGLVLDFNFAYNPSCAYDDRWSCPLSPPENRLPFAVTAGERMAGNA